MNPILHVVFSSSVGFLFLFVITKMMGKKQIAQLSFLDYVIGISLGSIAAEMATDSTKPFYYYLIGMALYLILDFILTFTARKGLFFKKLIRGKPMILVEKGEINYKNLVKSKLDINDLLCMCRAKGYFDMRDVSYCIFETSGELSILPAVRAVVAKSIEVGYTPSSPDLSKDLVVDGKIVNAALEQVNKTREWLLKRLGMENDDVKSIALATYYQETDELKIHNK